MRSTHSDLDWVREKVRSGQSGGPVDGDHRTSWEPHKAPPPNTAPLFPPHTLYSDPTLRDTSRATRATRVVRKSQVLPLLPPEVGVRSAHWGRGEWGQQSRRRKVEQCQVSLQTDRGRCGPGAAGQLGPSLPAPSNASFFQGLPPAPNL